MEQALIELTQEAAFEDEFELDIRVSAPASDAQPTALATFNSCNPGCETLYHCPQH
ncbi:hypothetical protein EI42_03078 [Thermosporothrix hazakensis]|jgi:hypothetical protein|uniref:Uncharacterized protein n=2 Tax=Thermosporothrix TaxID=768650 RepID=A0A326U5V7_THEHA|nr:hypothetical protein [Thermosporothrix hazakensis]PZW29356.1 hypothetical protein EI42_03078 [Thermosporothrix hazakensis]BBH86285.1 hypothetical protein KTC_10360 [Thermosporothrix sp. COM3]GCE45294.1 hypothetical protein KTH_01630 [Thermosporothrix hazakensis]